MVAMRNHESLFCLPIYESSLIVGAAAGGYAILKEYAAEGNSQFAKVFDSTEQVLFDG